MTSNMDDPVPLDVDKAKVTAEEIIAIPSRELGESIRAMVSERKFSRVVRELNALVLDHPEHKRLGARALDHLGLWP